ncbi:TPA: hypothetical protein DEB02_04725 [Candidatus Beckwithbacteria bacterium]|nr:hypothetical protein [Candidatus Beckwithbacteria bacterium]
MPEQPIPTPTSQPPAAKPASPAGRKETFEETVGKSLNQTITRSINTSLTVLIVLTALFFLGAEATKYFALALIIGIVAGTYSSIFIASPLLVTWNNYREKKI